MPKAKNTQENKTIDINDLVALITEQVTKKLAGEFEGKMQVALNEIKQSAETRSEVFRLTGGKDQYSIEADATSGLVFKKNDKDNIFIVGKNGQLATGTTSPRSLGKGSMHIKAGAPSEAIVPTVGDGGTRGLIIEGDGDDDKSFVLRGVSRMNRQGFNVFSDGSLALNSMKRVNDAALGVSHRHNDEPAASIHINSKVFEDDALKITASAPAVRSWNFLNFVAESDNTALSDNVFAVRGDGAVQTDHGFMSNNNGYAEYFEWADGNHKNQDRTGFAVTLDENAQLRIANEDDAVVGVVVKSAAVIGNAQWNNWKGLYFKDEYGSRKRTKYTVTEWLENETTLLKSHYTDTLGDNFALPDNATEYQTDMEGNDMYRGLKNHAVVDGSQEYQSREERREWGLVCLYGTVPVYKGQHTSPTWIKIKDLSDELELVIIK